jgi:hypothetical protein
VAFRGKSLVSKLIRFATRSKKYSHIAFLYCGDDLLVECWPSRDNPFQRWGFSSFSAHSPGTFYEIWELEVTLAQRISIREHFRIIAEEQVRYDWFGVLAFVFKVIRPNSNRLFCSEGCVLPLIKEFGWDINASHVSPQDFINFLSIAGAKLTYEGRL